MIAKEFYNTILDYNEFEIDKIKGSRFIGFIYPVKDKDEAEQALLLHQKKYYNVTHNCFAYLIRNNPSDISRFSDDGEPSGSAGRPIFTVLENSTVKNILIVVTRYFGGTKLGVGGLIKAYTLAAKAVLERAKIEQIEIKARIDFSYDYDLTNLVMNIVSQYQAKVIENSYADQARILIELNNSFKNSFIKEIFERSNGKISI